MEVVIPAELLIPPFWTWNFDPKNSELSIAVELDLLDKKIEQALVRIAHYKDQTVKFYNKHIFHCQFKIEIWL